MFANFSFVVRCPFFTGDWPVTMGREREREEEIGLANSSFAKRAPFPFCSG